MLIKNLFGTLTNKKIGILGFSFKANTNDIRESPSINISKILLQEGVKINFYDPKVEEKQILLEFNEDTNKDNITISKTALEAAQGADAILVLTEWKEFKELDWKRIYQVMRKPAWVFDSRICLNKKNLFDIGFKVWTLGTTYDCNLNK